MIFLSGKRRMNPADISNSHYIVVINFGPIDSGGVCSRKFHHHRALQTLIASLVSEFSVASYLYNRDARKFLEHTGYDVFDVHLKHGFGRPQRQRPRFKRVIDGHGPCLLPSWSLRPARPDQPAVQEAE